jgi:lipopolysaccharide heptosyltransferase II
MTLKRVLVVHPYGLGDFLFVTPVLRALRLIPTVEKVDLLLGSRTFEVVRENPHADEIFIVDKGRYQQQSRAQTFCEVAALGKELRSRHYDLMLDYSMRSEYAVFGRLFLGIPRTAGFNYKRRGLYHTIRFPLPEGFSQRSAVDTYCGLAERAGIRVEDRWMELYVSDSARVEAQKKWQAKTGRTEAGRFLFVSPGGGESWGKDAHFKQWPVSFFAELCLRLCGAGGFEGVVILGSPAEKDLAAGLAEKLRVPFLNFAGELSILESSALLERAALFLGNDGGLVHMAHALRIPLIAFYGPVDPAVYGPTPASSRALVVYKKDLACRPCYARFRYNSACEKRECLQELTPDEAWAQMEESGWFETVLKNR